MWFSEFMNNTYFTLLSASLFDIYFEDTLDLYGPNGETRSIALDSLLRPFESSPPTIDHQGALWLYLQYCRDKSNMSKEESNTNAFRFSSIIHKDRYRFMKVNIYGSAARGALLGGAFSPSEMWASSKVYPRDPQRARRAAHPPNKYGFHPSTFSDFDTNKPV